MVPSGTGKLVAIDILWRDPAARIGMARGAFRAMLHELYAEALYQAAARYPLAEAFPRGVGVTLLLTNDAEVHELNRDFRGKDKPTNVLSFPAVDVLVEHLGAYASRRRFPVGDIALSLDTAIREAAEQGKPLLHHLWHLTLHGFLHLLGLDHEVEREAEAMEALEARVLQRFSIPNPYAESDELLPASLMHPLSNPLEEHHEPLR